VQKLTLHRIHKWLGLSAALWLAVLGVTGFLLDHRDHWAWLWQSGVSPALVTTEIQHDATSGPFKLYYIDPLNQLHHITGGQNGLWWSGHAGQHWQAAQFSHRHSMPQVYAALYTIEERVSVLWLGTDDGLWHSDDSGRSFKRMALAGMPVTALTQGSADQSLLGVVDRSRVFVFDTTNKQLAYHTLSPVEEDQLPAAVGLSRLVRDLHYGRGVWTTPYSLLWNDIAGVALLVIPFTGLLFFILPRLWRRYKHDGVAVSHVWKKQSMRWLFRLHAPFLGLLACIPILYISITGIMLDHSEGLREFMQRTQVSRFWQPPVYSLSSWQGEIYSILGYPGKPAEFSVGTRSGLYTTTDSGKSWRRETLLTNKALFIWSLHRQDEQIFIGAMGGPNQYRANGSARWQVVKGAGHMPTAVNQLTEDLWWVKVRDGVRLGNQHTGFKPVSINYPQTGVIPWYYVLDGLHSGMLIHNQWKWINDLFALMACLLVISGLIRWWNKKWI